MKAFQRVIVTACLFAWTALPAPAPAIQPTPPVTLEIGTLQERDPLAAGLELRIEAQVEVSRPVLLIRTGERVAVEPERIPLRLQPDEPVRVEVQVRTQTPGVHPIEFRVIAEAEGYETAGTREIRYLVADGRTAARVLTGHELRAEERREAERVLEELRQSEPEGEVSIDTLLRGELAPVPEDMDLRGRGILQPQVAPSEGIEPYERDAVIDSSADVLRDLDPLTIRGRIFFTSRGGSLQPLVNATVDIRDSDTGPDEQLTSVVTGWDGRFQTVVNNDDGWFQNGRDIYIRVRTTNSRFRVQDCSYWPDWTYAWVSDVRNDLSDGTVVDFGSLFTETDNEASILFQDLNQGWNFLTTSGGQDPGFVDLCFPEDSSVYSTFWEEIDIEDGDEVARDIVLHEYGHAVMHNAYDGYWPSNTGGAHGFNDVLHPNFAFTEGWGTFIALAINDDGVYHSNGWSRNIEGFAHTSDHTDGDGPRNEGHVAAGLGDVRDTSSDGDCAAGDCDPSGVDATPMSVIWRDAFWRSNVDTVLELWDRLCGELGAPQRTAALDALPFNEIDVSSCVCSIELAVADRSDAPRMLAAIRDLRDRGLRQVPMGRRLIEMYYEHTPEVARLMMRDDSLRQMGLALVEQAARAQVLLRRGADSEVLVTPETAAVAHRFIARLQEMGSEELRQELNMADRLVDDFEGLPAGAIRAKLLGEARKK